MSSLSVFKKSKDRLQWHKYIEYFQTCSELPDSIKIEVVSSIRFFEQELGSDFLRSCNTRNHPFPKYLFELGLDSAQWLIRFKSVLERIKAIENSGYEKLLKLLRPKQKCYNEGLPFINISGSILDAGLNVRVNPTVSATKKPDLEFWDALTSENIFVEVTRLDDTDERKLIRLNAHIIFQALHMTPPYPEFSCIQKQVFKEERIDEVRTKILECKTRAHANRSFELLITEQIELGVAHRDEKDKLVEWCHQFTPIRELDFEGLPLDYDDSLRIRDNKLEHESKQIPGDSPGLIYIQADPLFFLATPLTKTIEVFQTRLAQLKSNIVGVVLFSYLGIVEENASVRVGDHYYGKRMVSALGCRALLFVANSSFSMPLSHNIRHKLYQSFEAF